GLPVELGARVGGNDHVVVGAGEGFLELREQGRVLRQVAAHLLDVGRVVQADAHDLARGGDDRGVVGGAEVDGLSGCLFGDRLPVRIGEQRGQVGVAVDDGGAGVAVDADGGGAAVEAEGGETHGVQAP